MSPSRDSRRWVLLVLLVILIAIGVASVATGAMPIPPRDVLAIFGQRLGLDVGAVDATHVTVVETLRLPRTLLSALVGAALAVSGAVLQGVFRNPLVDPGLIGVSAGSALGAALSIVLGTVLVPAPLRAAALPVAAFAGGLLATLAVYRLGRRHGRTSVSAMLLAGIAINALVGAGIALLSFLSNDAQLRQVTFWSFGGLGGASWPVVAIAAPCILLPLLLLTRLARPLDMLLLGESEAAHLGVRVERIKLVAIACSALAVGASVAAAGLIGFVGLVAPHLLRLALGPQHRLLVPASALLGAALLLSADIVSRVVVRPAELPIGIVTAFLGAPVFLWLLRSRGVPEAAR